MRKNSRKNRFAAGVFGAFMAAAVIMQSIPMNAMMAAGRTVYVSGFGNSENTGNEPDSPLGSIYTAADMLTEGGVICVMETIYIAGETSYSLPEGITVKADESLDGPVFAVENGAKLSLNNIVIDGNSETLIQSEGEVEVLDHVVFMVAGEEREASEVIYEYTNENVESEESEAQSETVESEESETQSEMAESEESETQSETVESEESEAQYETVESEEREAQSETVESEESETQSETVESEEREAQSETVESEESEAQSEMVESEESEAQSETVEVVFMQVVKAVETQIQNLSVGSRSDVAKVLEATRAYDMLSDAEKNLVAQKTKMELTAAQELAGMYNHTDAGVSVSGNIPWYVQFRVTEKETADRQEDGFVILIPYELKLWDLYHEEQYLLEEGQKVRVSMPIPEGADLENLTIFHYKEDGSVEHIAPEINADMLSFETGSFSPFSVAGSSVIAGIGVADGTVSDVPTSSTASQTETPAAGDTSLTTESGTYSSQSDSLTAAQPAQASTNTAAATGDYTAILPYIIAAIAAVLLVVVVVITGKKKKK